jgi:hypothetical protein
MKHSQSMGFVNAQMALQLWEDYKRDLPSHEDTLPPPVRFLETPDSMAAYQRTKPLGGLTRFNITTCRKGVFTQHVVYAVSRRMARRIVNHMLATKEAKQRRVEEVKA